MLFVLVLNINSTLNASIQPDTIVKYDSSAVKTVSPSVVKEEQIFSDKDMKYEKKEAKDVGWFGKFINWILEKFFGGTDPQSRDKALDIFIWTLVFIGAVIIAWLLSRSDFVKFLKGKPRETEFNFLDVNEDIKGIDFNARILAALNEQNFRLAVRWYYLKQLNALNNSGLIQWQTYKTNIDYFKELKNSSYKNAFRNISGIYDYVWYGQYDINPTNYAQMEEQFKQFEMLLNNVQRKP